jgi:hypothetical protein
MMTSTKVCTMKRCDQKQAGNGTPYLALQLQDGSWCASWFPNLNSALQAAFDSGNECEIELTASKKTDKKGNPYMNVTAVNGEEGIEPPAPTGGGGTAAQPAARTHRGTAADALTGEVTHRLATIDALSRLAMAGLIVRDEPSFWLWQERIEAYLKTGQRPAAR